LFGLGPTEIIVIFLLIIILFGAKRLPELARSMGRSIKEFKHATQGLKDEFDVDKIDESPSQKNVQPQDPGAAAEKKEPEKDSK
jgi:sec-independent protein translocase protein TatA